MIINLKSTSLMVTEFCTLKCKLCLSYSPYFNKPKRLEYNDAKKVLKKYFNTINYVEKFAITGGEPLTNKEIVSILDLIYLYRAQIGQIIFITNGTLEFPEKILELLKRYKNQTKVIINNYGNDISIQAEQIYKKLTDEVYVEKKENVILYNEDNRNGWIDCRNHDLKHFNIEEIKNQSEKCEFFQGKKFIINRGELHLCTRSYYRIYSGIIPKDQKYFIDLLDSNETIDQCRMRILQMLKSPYYSSCAYCEGLTIDTKKYPAAEQLM